jgi:hypothetical protein
MNMKTMIFSVVLAIALMACGTTKESQTGNESFNYKYEDNGQINEAVVEGQIIDEAGEPIIGAKVVLYQDGVAFIAGAATDIDGRFYIKTNYEGPARIRVEYIGMVSKNLPERFTLELIHGKTIIFNDTLQMQESQIKLLKPMVYLYPEDTIAVSVKVKTPGELLNCYPAMVDQWDITACPDGNLIDKKGRNYYGLYWESNLSNIFTITNGSIVAREDNIRFMEKSLKKLGLNDHEANEFIVFWLPILNQSKYNLIHFSTDVYDEKIPLIVSPKPDRMIRIMLFYKPLEAPMTFPAQNLEQVSTDRKGFTVVEWGGSEIKEELINRSSRLRSMSGINSSIGTD